MAKPPERRDKEVAFCCNCPLDDCRRLSHGCLLRICNSAGLSFNEAYQIAKMTVDSERYRQYDPAMAARAFKRMALQVSERKRLLKNA